MLYRKKPDQNRTTKKPSTPLDSLVTFSPFSNAQFPTSQRIVNGKYWASLTANLVLTKIGPSWNESAAMRLIKIRDTPDVGTRWPVCE